GRKPLRQRLGHTAPEHVVEPDPRLEIVAVRRAPDRMEDRAGLGHDLERPERAGIGEEGRVGERLEDHLRRDHRAVAARIVGGASLLRVAPDIDREAIGRNTDRSAPEGAAILLFLDRLNARRSVLRPPRLRRSPSSNRSRSAARYASRPYASTRRPLRPSALRLAATWAQRSLLTKSGRRELTAMMSNTGAMARPFLNSLTAGSRKPSWKISETSTAIEPGVLPPTSFQCAIEAVHATSSASAKTGSATTTSLRCVTPPK